MGAAAIDNQTFNPLTLPPNGQEALALQNFKTTFQKPLEEMTNLLSSQEKQSIDATNVSQGVTPNSPEARRRNMELLHVLIIEAVKSNIFLEFLFTAHQMELIENLLETYKSLSEKEAEQRRLHQNLQFLASHNESRKLEVLRAICALQSKLYSLQCEIKKIYEELGATFKDMFEGLIDLSNPNKMIDLNIPGAGNIQVNHNELAAYVGNQVSGKIARGEVALEEKSIEREVSKAAFEFSAIRHPRLRELFKDKEPPHIVIPEFIDVLKSFSKDSKKSQVKLEQCLNEKSHHVNEIKSITLKMEAKPPENANGQRYNSPIQSFSFFNSEDKLHAKDAREENAVIPEALRPPPINPEYKEPAALNPKQHAARSELIANPRKKESENAANEEKVHQSPKRSRF